MKFEEWWAANAGQYCYDEAGAAEAAWRAATERCAKLCDRIADEERSLGDEGWPEYYEGMARRIREGGASG